MATNADVTSPMPIRSSSHDWCFNCRDERPDTPGLFEPMVGALTARLSFSDSETGQTKRRRIDLYGDRTQRPFSSALHFVAPSAPRDSVSLPIRAGLSVPDANNNSRACLWPTETTRRLQPAMNADLTFTRIAHMQRFRD